MLAYYSCEILLDVLMLVYILMPSSILSLFLLRLPVLMLPLVMPEGAFCAMLTDRMQ